MNRFPVQRGLGRYLIMVGQRLSDFAYDDDVVYDNVDYFWDMYKSDISPYKALTLLSAYLDEKEEED